MEELLQLALEGRRRVKEQLKKMGSFEYYQTSFSYQISETGEEKFVGVPEQGGNNLISPNPMAPGTIYSASVSGDELWACIASRSRSRPEPASSNRLAVSRE